MPLEYQDLGLLGFMFYSLEGQRKDAVTKSSVPLFTVRGVSVRLINNGCIKFEQVDMANFGYKNGYASAGAATTSPRLVHTRRLGCIFSF